MTFKGLVAPGWDFGWEEVSEGLIILPKLGHWCECVWVQIKTMEIQCWSEEQSMLLDGHIMYFTVHNTKNQQFYNVIFYVIFLHPNSSSCSQHKPISRPHNNPDAYVHFLKGTYFTSVFTFCQQICSCARGSPSERWKWCQLGIGAV